MAGYCHHESCYVVVFIEAQRQCTERGCWLCQIVKYVAIESSIIVHYSSNCILGLGHSAHVLAALVRHSQAQKCIQINPKAFQQVN